MLYAVMPKHNLFGVVFIPCVFPKAVFSIDATPISGPIRRYTVRCVSKHCHQIVPNIEFIRYCVPKILKDDIHQFVELMF